MEICIIHAAFNPGSNLTVTLEYFFKNKFHLMFSQCPGTWHA